MSCKQSLKEFFLKCDIFSTSQFLRYEGEPEYRTYTGAMCSIITVASFCAIFINVIVSTFAKTEVVWSLNTVEDSLDSFSITADTRGSQKFMFAAALSGYDFRNQTQTFSVSLILRKKEYLIDSTDEYVKLQECTKAHWAVSQEMLQTFDRMNFSTMLCPPIGLSIPIQGKFTSEIFQYAEIRIRGCNANSSKICQAPSANKSYFFNLFILNTLINPQESEYLTYYLQDRNYVQFTTTFTSSVNIFVSNYKITTDQSIWPIASKGFESGAFVSNLGQNLPQPSNGVDYASIFLRRSSTAVIVERSFKKIDETLSYIGGLFGFVVILLLFMKEYTEYSFELDASQHLYHVEPNQSVPNFNFLVFVGYIFFMLLDALGIAPEWKYMKDIDQSREQIQKQLDVRFLFQRINFLQKSVGMLFNQDQSKVLHLHRKSTLKEASQLREAYLSKKIIQSQNPNQQTENPLDNPNQNLGVPFGQRNKVFPEIKEQSRSIVEKMKSGIKLLRKKTLSGDHLSKKIIEDIDPNIVKIIFQGNEESHKDQKQDNGSLMKLQKSERQKGPKYNQAENDELQNYRDSKFIIPPNSQRKRSQAYKKHSNISTDIFILVIP